MAVGGPDVSVIIPAYNEEKRLAPTVREAVDYFRGRSRSVEIIVVDDGSRDRTSDLTHHLGAEMREVRLIRLAANAGKGYAVRTGVVNARGRLVMFMDADGATPIAEFERLETAIDGGAAMAIGSRVLHGQGVRVRARFYRRLMGRSFHALVRALTVRGISDTQCGFKMFRGEVAHDLFSRMRMTGFSFDVEVLVMAQLLGLRVAEVPVNWTHQPGSRVNLVRDSLHMAYDLLVIRTHVLRGDYDAPHVAPLSGVAVVVDPIDDESEGPEPRSRRRRALWHHASPTTHVRCDRPGRAMKIPRRQPPVVSHVSPSAVLAAARVAARRYAGRVDRGNEVVRSALSTRYDARAVALTDSGTAALVLAMRLTAPRGTVALPAYGCVDLIAAAVRARVRVRLYDVDPATLSPDLDSVRQALARGADAVVVAHFYGYPADIPGVRALADAAGARVIEDAAQHAGGR